VLQQKETLQICMYLDLSNVLCHGLPVLVQATRRCFSGSVVLEESSTSTHVSNGVSRYAALSFSD
jgi:hypothetical protein